MEKRRLYIGIDDTDEIGYDLSTGRICERIRAGLIDRYRIHAEPITRHQLLLHEEIAYTSHNSAMCFVVEIDEPLRGPLADDIVDEVRRLSAPASSPGVCIGFEHEFTDTTALIDYGLRTKKQIIAREEACRMAERQNLSLVGLQNNGEGVIGALAGIGLRLSGKDGKIRGKFRLERDRHTVRELLETGLVDDVCLPDGTLIDGDATVETHRELKIVYRDYRRVLLVDACASGYRPLERQKILDL